MTSLLVILFSMVTNLGTANLFDENINTYKTNMFAPFKYIQHIFGFTDIHCKTTNILIKTALILHEFFKISHTQTVFTKYNTAPFTKKYITSILFCKSSNFSYEKTQNKEVP